MSLTTVRNDEGRHFAVRVVRNGDAYGRDSVLTHDKDDALVEFYDLTYPERFGPDGQFVARYYASTLLERPHGYGLSLWLDVPAWSIDRDAMDKVLNWLQEVVA